MWCRQGERCKPIFIASKNLVEHQEQFQDWAGKWLPVNIERPGLVQLRIPTETEWLEGGTGSELREQVEAIKRWYRNDWIALDNKLRSQ